MTHIYHNFYFTEIILHSTAVVSCADTKKDLRKITLYLLDMLPSKKVSGQGRDRALNLLNKNVPRKDQRDHDNSRTIFVIDNGKRTLRILSSGRGFTTEQKSSCASEILTSPSLINITGRCAEAC